jgi:hypothetical protein
MIDANPSPKTNPWGLKKRYSILLSEELTERFERVARLRSGAKSALVEEAPDRRLNPQKYSQIDKLLLRRLDEHALSFATPRRDDQHRGDLAVRALFPHHHAASCRQRTTICARAGPAALRGLTRSTSATDDVSLKVPAVDNSKGSAVLSFKSNGQIFSASLPEKRHG